MPRRHRARSAWPLSVFWVKSPEMKVNDVGEMKAGAVRWLSEKLASVYTEAMESTQKNNRRHALRARWRRGTNGTTHGLAM